MCMPFFVEALLRGSRVMRLFEIHIIVLNIKFTLFVGHSKRSKGSRRHRRSKSAEASFMLHKDFTMTTDSDYRTSDYSPPVPDSDITGKCSYGNNCVMVTCCHGNRNNIDEKFTKKITG